jgi:hypothetical protein
MLFQCELKLFDQSDIATPFKEKFNLL